MIFQRCCIEDVDLTPSSVYTSPAGHKWVQGQVHSALQVFSQHWGVLLCVQEQSATVMSNHQEHTWLFDIMAVTKKTLGLVCVKSADDVKNKAPPQTLYRGGVIINYHERSAAFPDREEEQCRITAKCC